MIFQHESVLELHDRLMDDLETGKIEPEECYRRLLELNPHDSHALFETGSLRAEAGDPGAAETYYWKAIEEQPCDWGPWMGLTRIAEARGDTALSRGLAEIGLRRLLFDPDAALVMEEHPESFAEFRIVGEEEDPEPRSRIQKMVDMVRAHRADEPPEVADRLRIHRLLLEMQEAEDLQPALVDAIVAEGEAAAPGLIGFLRCYADSGIFDDRTGVIEDALALLGEIGSASALGPVVEFNSLEDENLSGAAGWAFDRIVDLHPDEAERELLALAPGLSGPLRLSIADRLIFRPKWSATDRLFESLADGAAVIPPEDRGEFFSTLIIAMIVSRRREGVEMARRLFRRNANLLDRESRRICDDQIAFYTENGGAMLQGMEDPQRSEFTVYQICAGEAVWPSFDEEDEEDEEPGEENGLDEDEDGEEQPALRVDLPGRNDPCWCGSGKKYKKCHLTEDEERSRGLIS